MRQKTLAILLLLSYFTVVLHDVIPHDHHEDLAMVDMHEHDRLENIDHDHENYLGDVLDHFTIESADHHHHQNYTHLADANFFSENRLDQKSKTEKLRNLSQPLLELVCW